MTLWALTTDGILDSKGDQIDTPFDNLLVHRGQLNSDKTKLAVIAQRSQIWIYHLQTEKWTQLIITEWQLNCLLWVDEELLVGTEKARLGWVKNNTLEFIESFDKIDTRDNWTTPRGGEPNIRSLAITADGTIAANIHVGWIATSDDNGMTWNANPSGLHKDVHHVVAHPNEEGVLTCATAGGFHISFDGGDSFEKRWKQSKTYQRTTAWLESHDEDIPDVLLTSVSRGPSGSGAELWKSINDGQNWQQINQLGRVNENINTYQILAKERGEAYVIINNSRIVKTDDYGITWSIIVENLPKTYQIIMIK